MANTITPADTQNSTLSGWPAQPGSLSPQQMADQRVKYSGTANTTGNATNPPTSAFGTASAGSFLTGSTATIPVWRIAPTPNPGGAGSSAAADNQYNLAHPPAPAVFSEKDAQMQFGMILQDPKLMQAWQDAALKSGLVTPTTVNDVTALETAWNQAVKDAIMISQISKGQNQITPFEAAQMVAENSGARLLAEQRAQEAKIAAQTFTGTKPGVTTTTVDNKSSYSNADVLRNMLGRTPTAGEQAAYQHGINTVAQANPIVTKRSDTFVNGQQTAQTDTSTGGFDLAAAQQQAASSASPQVAAHQQATTYYQALVQALSAAA